MRTVAQACVRVWRIAVEVARKYGEDRGPLIAAAISFFALLSLIPLALLAVWGLGHVLSSERALRSVVAYLRDYFPASGELIRDYLEELVHGRGTIGGLGVIGLAWTGSQGFVILEMAMNVALRVPDRRSFLRSRLVGLGMVLVAGGLLALSLAITSTVTTIRGYTVPGLGWKAGDVPGVWVVVGAVVPVLLTCFSFTITYYAVPNVPIRLRAAAIAGGVTGLLWEVAKRGYAYFVEHSTFYGQFYGSISGLVGLVVWIYYSSVILVLGAELASVLQDVHPRSSARRTTVHGTRTGG